MESSPLVGSSAWRSAQYLSLMTLGRVTLQSAWIVTLPQMVTKDNISVRTKERDGRIPFRGRLSHQGEGGKSQMHVAREMEKQRKGCGT